MNYTFRHLSVLQQMGKVSKNSTRATPDEVLVSFPRSHWPELSRTAPKGAGECHLVMCEEEREMSFAEYS